MFSPPPPAPRRTQQSPNERSRSSFDEDSETESLTDSTLDYPYHWGRRYHKFHEGAYLYPNDEHEQDRQDFEHAILQKYVFGKKLFFAPIVENPRNILDVGTGTGIWAIEMAQQFPNARVKGWDLSVIQPMNAPGNVNWEVFDCTSNDWGVSSKCDYVHVSMMFGALSRYKDMICKARDCLVPGTGWLECQELLMPTVFSDDNSIPQQCAFKQWLDRFQDASSKLVHPPRQVLVADKLKQWMERAGLVDVHEVSRSIPIGTWPQARSLQRMGGLWRDNLERALAGWSYKTLGPDGSGMSRNEIEVLLARVREDLHNSEIHGYHKIFCVYGRRPTSDEAKTLRGHGHPGAQATSRGHPATGATLSTSKHGNVHPASKNRSAQPRPNRDPPTKNGNGASLLA